MGEKNSSPKRPARYPKKRLILAASGISWALLVVAGLLTMSAYKSSEGVAATPSIQFPAESRIQRTRGNATLVMLAHPHCPCTRASIGELALLMAQTQGRVTAYVLFLKPPNSTDDWEKTDLWDSAAIIPGVNVLRDTDGIEAARFHAATSGQTVLYDAQGQLLFHGGITGARGHAGDNAGRSAIVSLLNEGTAEQTETPVYGCQLFDTSSECRMPELNHATHSH